MARRPTASSAWPAAARPLLRRACCAALPLLAALALAACGTPGTVPQASDRPAAATPPAGPAEAHPPWPEARGEVAGRRERLLVYVPRRGDSLDGIAARFLGGAEQAWQIAEANGQRWTVNAGEPLVVPLVAGNPLGVSADAVQAVTVLCYHRLGTAATKMVVAPADFEAQLDWLAREHYRVIRLADLAEFLAGRRQLPQRSVVITFDDGYESVYRYAYPVLRKHGFPATLFMYTDFIGSRDALSWTQLDTMARSGLIDIEAHSKTHRNLARPLVGESDEAYRQSLDTELRQPRTVLERQLGAAGVQVRYFAYPYGDANDAVLQVAQREKYALGLTVTPGGNSFYADPLLLRRTMIFGDISLDDFKARLTQRGPGR